MIYLLEKVNQQDHFDMEHFWSFLSAQRREKILRYRFIEDKKVSMLTYLLLRFALFSEYGITQMPEFTLDENSKPSLKSYPDIHFNLSHCIAGVLCAVSGANIGADIQEYTPYEEDIYRSVLSENEMQAIHESDDKNTCFTRFWSLKESYGKYCSKGLGFELSDYDFNGLKTEWDNRYGFHFYSEYRKDCTIAVCAEEYLDRRIITAEDLKSCFENTMENKLQILR